MQVRSPFTRVVYWVVQSVLIHYLIHAWVECPHGLVMNNVLLGADRYGGNGKENVPFVLLSVKHDSPFVQI